MQKLLRQVKSLHSSEELDQYSDMRLEALAEQKKLVDVEIEAIDLRAEFIKQVLAGTTIEQIATFERKIADLETQARQLALKARALNEDADDYYKEKKLG
jgi:hypothetical protein